MDFMKQIPTKKESTHVTINRTIYKNKLTSIKVWMLRGGKNPTTERKLLCILRKNKRTKEHRQTSHHHDKLPFIYNLQKEKQNTKKIYHLDP